MTISSTSIRKLFREHFPGDDPIRVGEGERKALAKTLLGPFEGDPWVDTKEWQRPAVEDEHRYVHLFTLNDPEDRYGCYSDNTYRLMLDEKRRLMIEGPRRSQSRETALISSSDELFAFIRECKHRLERQRALKSRRRKVRGFKHAAMQAQLKQVAREHGFTFMTEVSASRIKLWIKLTDKNAIELHFRPIRFPDVLPRLPSVIRALRESFEAEVKFKIVTPRGLPWRTEWIEPGE